MYRYVHNLQGDIVAILDAAGNPVVEYKYDPWGNSYGGASIADIGVLNPLRYRGYVYDNEIGMCYLRSRYYKPEWCRFINADTVLGQVGTVGPHNLFAYCGNIPVVMADPDGKESVPVPTASFPDLGAVLRGMLESLKSALLKGSIIGSILHEARRQWDKSIHVADEKTDTPEKDITTDGTYHFAHVSDDGSIFAYLKPELTLDQAQAASTLAAWTHYSGILQYDEIGFYTKNRADAEKLAVLLGGSISRPDNHVNSVGIIYLHFHDFDHEIHIWYGSPVF